MLDASTDNGNAALQYAAAGLAVFPCHYIRDGGGCSCGKADCDSPGKHPITPNGCHDATTASGKVRLWWQANPDANIGCAMGEPSGLWALDIEADGLDDWSAVIAAEGEEPPYAPVSQTGGGGKHLFFKLNGEPIRNRAKINGCAIDVRGDGGYVLLPPSNHASGNRYAWLQSMDDAEPEDGPAWLVRLVTGSGTAPVAGGIASPAAGGFIMQASGFDDAPQGRQGSRHNDLLAYVGKEFARGAQIDEVMQTAHAWAADCQPPHDPADVTRAVNDIAGREFARLQNAKSGTAAPDATTSAGPFKLPFLTSQEFSDTDYRMRFLIKRVLVAGQPAIIGGPKKSLKTSLLVDLALSLGTGRPFLGCFDVPERVNVGILSGESGGFTLKETANRVALSKGVLLSGSSTHWCFDLPMLSRPDHLQVLTDAIRERDFEVVIVDPAYLCLLDDGRAESAGNVFRMGNALRTFAQVGTDTDSTLILCHHSTKAAGRSLEPLELEDLSQSGFAEFARQWLLVNRREPFEFGSGQHHLWLSVGGSAGHSGLYGVDVDEGVLQDDFSGRTWEVDVQPVGKLMMDKAAADAERKRQEEADTLRERREKIVAILRRFPDGQTKTAIRDMTTLNSAAFNQVFESLAADGTITPCEVQKGNRVTPYPGFKLAQIEPPGHPDSTTGTSSPTDGTTTSRTHVPGGDVVPSGGGRGGPSDSKSESESYTF